MSILGSWGGGIRTNDPIFSFVIKGARQHLFLKHTSSCFGSNCVYDVLVRLGGKIILFGNENLGYTFSHFCEQKARVRYRFFKEFKGKIIDGNEHKEYKISCYLRRDLSKYNLNIAKQIRILKRDNNFKRINFANSCIVSIDAKRYLRANLRALRKDEFALVDT